MVKNKKLLDAIHLQKYIYLFNAFLNNDIEPSVFETYFLQTRRDDPYWMTSSFSNEINRIMDSIFLDVDEYTPPELYDPDYKYNINEDELRKRLRENLMNLKKLI